MAPNRRQPAAHAWPELATQPLHPKKSMGQHFLTNRGILQQIVAAADLSPHDTVIEVGPGTGTLTRELLSQAGSVIAVELDRSLVARLQGELGSDPRLRLVQGNILALPPGTLLASGGIERASPGLCGDYKVVANLPYYIAAPTLRHFLAGDCSPSLMVVMVQWEVARQITAQPGDMSLLSIAVQFYGRPQLVTKVAPGSFFPPPKVSSAVIRVDVYTRPPVDVPSPQLFFETVRAGFAAPRKQLHNSLAQGLAVAPAEAGELLQQAAIDPQRRAETLALEEWATLTRVRAAGS